MLTHLHKDIILTAEIIPSLLGKKAEAAMGAPGERWTLFLLEHVSEKTLIFRTSGENVRTITKRDYARILAEEMGLEKTRAMQFVAAFFQTMTETIIQGNRIEARGFGVFTVKNTNAKPDVRNPKTGEQVFVPKRRMVCFKPGKALRVELSKPVEIEE